MDKIQQARYWIEDADYVIIGAGAGLSEAAGFHYSGETFQKNFSDFIEKYGITDMYSGTFYPFETLEEKWAYWARVIQLNVYDAKKTKVYQELLELVKDKKYFVITTNADHQFAINGFDMNRFFEVQGNYVYMQCSHGCHSHVYHNQGLIQHMVKQTKDCRIPSALVPYCPVCGKPMDVHVRKDQYFVETKGWQHYCQNYNKFLRKALRHKTVFIEIGVGFNTPTIIRYPFEKMSYQNKKAHLIRINKNHAFSLEGNEENVINFDKDVLTVLKDLQVNKEELIYAIS